MKGYGWWILRWSSTQVNPSIFSLISICPTSYLPIMILMWKDHLWHICNTVCSSFHQAISTTFQQQLYFLLQQELPVLWCSRIGEAAGPLFKFSLIPIPQYCNNCSELNHYNISAIQGNSHNAYNLCNKQTNATITICRSLPTSRDVLTMTLDDNELFLSLSSLLTITLSHLHWPTMFESLSCNPFFVFCILYFAFNICVFAVVSCNEQLWLKSTFFFSCPSSSIPTLVIHSFIH